MGAAASNPRATATATAVPFGSDDDHRALPAEREIALLRAEVAAARADATRAAAAADAARELNVELLAALDRAAPTLQRIRELEARAARADHMAATRLWRWSHYPRQAYAALRRALGISRPPLS